MIVFVDLSDGKGHIVLRDMHGAPMAFVDDSWMPRSQQETVANLMAAAPELQSAVERVIAARRRGEKWGDEEWRVWERNVGSALGMIVGIA